MINEKELKKKYPITNNIKKYNNEIKKILSGKSKKFILIIGPCSSYSNKAIIEYAKKLKKLQKNYDDKIFFILRCYTQKPRTTIGWTGSVIQPNPQKKPDIKKGIIYCRKMMCEINKIGIPIADELLFINLHKYFDDIISYLALGARSCENQEHRNFSSQKNKIIGIKNPTNGDKNILINSLIASNNPQSFFYNEKQINTKGNEFSHLILRGGKKPNYYKKDILEIVNLLKKNKLKKKIIIDCNHSNSQKNFLKQINIAKYILKLKNKNICGLMIESFLEDGCQKISNKMINGKSITDSCLGFEKTKLVIEDIYKSL